MSNRDNIIINPQEIIGRFYSLEFSLKDLLYSYRFKIQAISNDCIEVIIKEDSEIINYIKEGDIVDIRFYSQRLSYDPKVIKCEIKKVLKENSGRFKGHYRVQICTLDFSNPDLN